MIKFFSNIKALNPLFLLGFLIVIRLFFLLGNFTDIVWQPLTENYTNYIFSILNTNYYVSFLISTAIVYISALLLNNVVIQHEILFRKNFLAAYFYCLIASIFPQYYFLGPSIFVNVLMIIAMQKLFELYKAPYPFDNIFLISILVGISTLFSLSYITFFLFTIIGITFFRTIKAKEILASILGFILPIFIAFMLNYLLNNIYLPEYLNLPKFEIKEIKFQLLFSPLIIVLIISAFSTIRVANNFWRNTIKTRRAFLLVYIYLFLVILLVFTGKENPVQESLLLCIPFSLILAHYFTTENKLKWYRKLMHITLLLSVLAFQYKFLWM